MKKLFLFIGMFATVMAIAQTPLTPDKIYGRLFHDVQMARVFPDSKTFADCTPKKSPASIVAEYQRVRSNPGIRFSIKLFTEENFDPPPTPAPNNVAGEKDIVAHIKKSWSLLKHEPGKVVEGNSLLPLPYPYIVPGGRFREMCYWDSYFIMLGLKESNENGLLENMVQNFAYLIDSIGHIPNGNRSYYLSRSQPPFFSLMVELLATIKGDQVYSTYLPALEKEYQYWMDGSEKLKPMQAAKAAVRMKDGALLNRYWDESDEPRTEAYYEDLSLGEKLPAPVAAKLYRELRAAAASGWDVSSRWMTVQKSLQGLETTNYVPVDLNSLLYKLELVIARGELWQHHDSTAARYNRKAAARVEAIDKYCWNKNLNFYTDYNFVQQKPSSVVSVAGLYPFCFFEQKPDYMSLLASRAAIVVKKSLLKDGGLVSTENNSGQQWDAPNGAAPLQWMAVWGLDRCGQKELARDIAARWMKLNLQVFAQSGKLLQQYNVADTSTAQNAAPDGFAWSSGVFLKLVSLYGLPHTD